MAESFLGEVRIFGFNFAPANWAACSGQILPIRQNTALFSLLGVTYGGNGSTTFALPNCNDSVVIGAGTQPGGGTYALGEAGGAAGVALVSAQMPPHTHSFQAASFRSSGNSNAPVPLNALAKGVGCNQYALADPAPAKVAMASGTLGAFGAAVPAPHSNQMPYTAVNFCISLAGNWPPRP